MVQDWGILDEAAVAVAACYSRQSKWLSRECQGAKEHKYYILRVVDAPGAVVLARKGCQAPQSHHSGQVSGRQGTTRDERGATTENTRSSPIAITNWSSRRIEPHETGEPEPHARRASGTSRGGAARRPSWSSSGRRVGAPRPPHHCRRPAPRRITPCGLPFDCPSFSCFWATLLARSASSLFRPIPPLLLFPLLSAPLLFPLFLLSPPPFPTVGLAPPPFPTLGHHHGLLPFG